jgi:ribosomal-protein-alanine N-acetyltransferase
MHILLSPPDPAHAELGMQWRAEISTLRYNPLTPSTLEQLRARLGSARSDLADLSAAPEFCLFAEVDGKVAGSLTLKGVSQMMMYGEIGYSIGEAFQGKGLGTAAVRAFVAKIFAETPLRRLYAHVAEGNAASRKLLERLGFVNEGTLREHYVINGVPTNEVVYGLLRSEF